MKSKLISFYNEEIVYSAVARYHHRSGNVDYKDTLEEAFGTRSIVSTIYFPSRLEHLSLSTIYTSDELINQYTLFPLYSCFLPEKRKQDIKALMKRDGGNCIYTKIGMVAGSICSKNGLYYCPLCVKEDLNKYGESYFRRIHQVQGIYICDTHSCVLKAYPLTTETESRIKFIRLNETKISLNPEYYKDIKIIEKLSDIVKTTKYILDNNFEKINQELIHDKYIQYLRYKDLVSVKKSISQKDLYNEFKYYYSNSILNIFESNIELDNESNWLKIITRKPKRVVHPIRHILLINFLCSDTEEFFNTDKKIYRPFGNRPWPCLNIACSNYKKMVIKHCNITVDYKIKQPVGTFECSCGFIYSRRGPDINNNDKYKVGRIKNYGKVWQDKLNGLIIQDKYSVREIARRMRCDSKTVIKYGNAYKNFSPDETLRNQVNSIRVQNNFEAINNSCINKSVEFNDKELKNNEMNLNINNRVDWDKRDAEIVSMLKVAYEQLIIDKELVRITKSMLGKKISKSALLYYYIDKLPKTKAYLEEITETIEEFQVRRVDNVCESLFNKEGQLKKWKIIKKAGLRNNYSKIVVERIEFNINRYSE